MKDMRGACDGHEGGGHVMDMRGACDGQALVEIPASDPVPPPPHTHTCTPPYTQGPTHLSQLWKKRACSSSNIMRAASMLSPYKASTEAPGSQGKAGQWQARPTCHSSTDLCACLLFSMYRQLLSIYRLLLSMYHVPPNTHVPRTTT